ncbi:capsular biosynthesis protein [Staphylococcus ursi]|uniref:tyrosine-protein phosphatase n=1 Tax=Staphylococcus sp. MI 10-1553 TaxID=1912064 RepID=UPI0013973CDF|nr:CpsB/CapC family capsule biosynthesis tyrosine phosphatase [Staphylococcus sp. MI 10-1553]QHW35956.1 capsular biosynthesis protein [Staphylococcus sp. MI 10-1553]
MIDIHNHILIGVDDGPQTETDMIALIQQAAEQGVTGIVATPHHLKPGIHNEANVVMEQLEKMKNHPEIQKLGMTFYPGQEVRISGDIIQRLEQGTVMGLNHSKYVLIELPSNEVPHYTKALFFELQQRGYIPVIAHPERNKAIAKNPERLYELVQNGALSQLTAGSLLGTFGKNIQKLSLQFITCHLAHVIASDAHSTEERPFQLQTLIEANKLRPYKETIRQLINNGSTMVNNIEIKRERPLKPTKHKKFFGLI